MKVTREQSIGLKRKCRLNDKGIYDYIGRSIWHWGKKKLVDESQKGPGCDCQKILASVTVREVQGPQEQENCARNTDTGQTWGHLMRKAKDAKGFCVFTESGAAKAGSHGELCSFDFYFHGLSEWCFSWYRAQRFCKSLTLPCLQAHTGSLSSTWPLTSA